MTDDDVEIYDEEELIEDAPEANMFAEMVMTTGFDMGPARKSKKEVEEDIDDSFAGCAVFECDSDVFTACREGKRKYLKYAEYVGEDAIGERIRQYGRTFPKKGIILRDKTTQAMLYLRRNG